MCRHILESRLCHHRRDLRPLPISLHLPQVCIQVPRHYEGGACRLVFNVRDRVGTRGYGGTFPTAETTVGEGEADMVNEEEGKGGEVKDGHIHEETTVRP